MSRAVQKIRTNVYLDSDIKNKAQEILSQYGIGLSDAFNIFLAQTVFEKGIPFEIKIPNSTFAPNLPKKQSKSIALK
ncbi:type II toxin-antitoxin system RelB/DinJ family antitoxin, partial [Sulfurimonas sp.]|uniref:type II toxin-antitoxin system RelB/DinJ family antitoxin n=1 Tax=Sulfurimonas sp. TaxID=2022749 RepID=UPI0025CFC86C